MHEHHRGEGAGARRAGQGRRKGPAGSAGRHLRLGEGAGPRVRRKRRRGRSRWKRRGRSGRYPRRQDPQAQVLPSDPGGRAAFIRSSNRASTLAKSPAVSRSANRSASRPGSAGARSCPRADEEAVNVTRTRSRRVVFTLAFSRGPVHGASRHGERLPRFPKTTTTAGGTWPPTVGYRRKAVKRYPIEMPSRPSTCQPCCSVTTVVTGSATW